MGLYDPEKLDKKTGLPPGMVEPPTHEETRKQQAALKAEHLRATDKKAAAKKDD